MKKVALFCGLMWLVASSSFAQQRTLQHRVGDAITGPVRSVRMERAYFTRRGETLVEGARQLVATRAYSPDGRRREEESYSPGGALLRRYVYLYGDDGSLTEQSSYDAGGALLDKKVYNRADNEELTFGGDGQLQRRRITVWNANHTSITEIVVYDGEGGLLERSVNTRDEANNTSIWTTYRADGSALKRDVHSLDYGGPHRTETENYGAGGAVVSRRVATSDAGVSNLKAAVRDADGETRSKTSEAREYDARRNLIRHTTSKWDEATGKVEPDSVTYTVITYYN